MDSILHTANQIRTLRMAHITLMPKESDYVVTVPHGTSERVAYGLTIPLSKRAAGQLTRALKPVYKGKMRAIMLKTAIKEGLFS